MASQGDCSNEADKSKEGGWTGCIHNTHLAVFLPSSSPPYPSLDHVLPFFFSAWASVGLSPPPPIYYTARRTCAMGSTGSRSGL